VDDVEQGMYTLVIDIEQEVVHLRGNFCGPNVSRWPKEHLIRVAGDGISGLDRGGRRYCWPLRGQFRLLHVVVMIG
jgi:hypothetical protein